eukprot:SAG11_NODE_119_length_15911_cov_7.077599_2_plen_202_part_00
MLCVCFVAVLKSIDSIGGNMYCLERRRATPNSSAAIKCDHRASWLLQRGLWVLHIVSHRNCLRFQLPMPSAVFACVCLQRSCPITTSVLQSIKAVQHIAAAGLGEALFSAISPGTHLKPHCGGTNARLTCHLPLLVPAAAKCTIRVGSESRSWEEGKCIVFDDSFEHEVSYAENGDSTEDRIVLLLRFWHPDVPHTAQGSW